MKSIVVTAENVSIETVLFPNLKVKPNNRNNDEIESDYYTSSMIPVGNCTRKDARREVKQKISIHLLETTQPNLLLQKIFQPYLILVKILGCQPLKIHPNGCATFQYFSWNVVYSVFIFGIFIFDTTYFLPIMKYMNSEQKQNPLVYITEIILVSSQIFAALISYIFMAVQANKLTGFWNRLQAVLIKLVARCPNHLDLVPSYRSARMKIIVWLMFTAVFGTCYITSFYDEIDAYLKEQLYNSFMYWTMFSGFAFYSVILSLHILHSTCFTTFICVFVSCFRTLGNIAMRQDGQGTMRNSQSPLLFHEVSEIYEELVELKTLLGQIYGVHIGLEILAMIICVTINIFFMISRPGFSSLFLLNIAIAIPYLIWFHGICESSGELNCSMKSCYFNVRKAMAIAAKNVPLEELSPLQVEQPEALSASGYFRIDMTLFTSVMGTIATYLVVMLQFMFSSGASRSEFNESTQTAAYFNTSPNGSG